MWKIHRYYLREVLVTALLTFLVLFGIVLMASLYRGIDRAQVGDPLSVILITFFWAADTFPHLLSMSLLIATVLTFARASQEREITSIRAAGISPRVPMVSAMLVGIAFSIVGMLAQHYVIPWAHFHKFRVTAEVLRNVINNSGLTGQKLAFGDFFMTWRGQDDQGHFLDVVGKLPRRSAPDDSGATLAGDRAFVADEAWIRISADGESIRLYLRDVRDAAGNHYGNPSIGMNRWAISEQSRRDESDKDLTSDQLLAEVDRGEHDRPNGARFTVHLRSCFGLMPCLLAPIGFCIGVLSRDRGRMTALLISLVPMVLFYGGVLVAPTLVRTTDWPLVGWLPAALVALPGLPFCWRLLRV